MKEETAQPNITRTILTSLGFPIHHIGYRLLCTTVPQYAQNPGISMTKELYPMLQTKRPCSAEAAIRRSIQYAWQHGSRENWEDVFPNCKSCPSNLAFIAVLAEYLL